MKVKVTFLSLSCEVKFFNALKLSKSFLSGFNTDKGVNIKIYTENGIREFDCEDVTKSKESWTKGYNKWKQQM